MTVREAAALRLCTLCLDGCDQKEKESILKEGEWNTLKIRAIDDEIVSWLNGTEMVRLQDEKIGNATGFVALQIHDGGGIKVRWKNIKIKPL